MSDVEFEPIARKILPVIFVIDNSGSMSGTKMDQVNKAMSEVGKLMADVAEENADAAVKVGAMVFSDNARWITNSGLVDCEDFIWDPVQVEGGTYLNKAIDELDKKLSRSAFLKSDTGFAVPIIIFMSDGQPFSGWKEADAKAKHNNWYDMARKIAIAIGDDADKECLAELVGNDELVIGISDKDVEVLKKLIVAVTVSATKIGTRTHSSEEKDPSTQIIKETVEQLGNDADKVETSVDEDDW
ncbi:MAG: VWA domain-containing protein [Bacilli bacterium]|nr:VWA domain-containing protein [Bacilli bacterium]